MSLLVIFGGAKRDLHTLFGLLSGENIRGQKIRMILVDQAKNLVSEKKLGSQLESLKIETFVLKEDVEAQDGSEDLRAKTKFIDYFGWVKLLEESERVLCWV